MDHPQPQQEHQWLHQLIGDWTFESECNMGPDQPPVKYDGSESVRSLGGLWTIGEMSGAIPGGGVSNSIMTLGFDPATKRFVGTFIASMMTHMWSYNGSLDESGKVLTLDTRGPNWAGDGGQADYQDIIEFLTPDHRTLTSRMKMPDGQWMHFMTAHYRRKA